MPAPLLAAIPAIVAAGTAIYGGIQAGKARKERRRADEAFQRALASRQDYQPAASVSQMLADASARKDAVNPALMAAFQQAQQQAAGVAGFAQRNASSGAQALSIAASAQAQAQSALPGLAQMQTQYQQNNVGNYYQALDRMGQENNLVHQDRMSRQSDLMNFYLGKVGAASQNQSQGMNTAAAGLMSIASMYGNGAFNNPYQQQQQLPPSYMYGTNGGLWG